MPTDRKAYMKDYMARKRADAKQKQQESKGLTETPATSDKTPKTDTQDMSTAVYEAAGIAIAASGFKPPWKVIPNPVAPTRNIHAECAKAERRSWQREQDARADYAAMLGLLRVIATAKEQAPGSRRYLVYEDTMTAILAITDAVHERERQAAEFAIDLEEPF